jgi:hypothetical protein
MSPAQIAIQLRQVPRPKREPVQASKAERRPLPPGHRWGTVGDLAAMFGRSPGFTVSDKRNDAANGAGEGDQ